MNSDRLDRWLPDPAIRTHHRRTAETDAERLWACARAVRLRDTRTLGRLVQWRIPGVPPAETFHGLLRQYPFTPLDEGRRHLVTGLCGRIWTASRDYPQLDGPDEFAAWDRRGTVRVLMAHWVEPDGAGGSELISEARIAPVDRAAAVRLRALWAFVGPLERFIGAEGLTLAVRRAEAR